MARRAAAGSRTAPPAATTGAQSIRRALAVLRILAVGQERGARLTDIAELSGLSRPTAHRILRVLAEEGAVEQDAATRRYLVGQEVSLLGLARSARAPVRAAAEPYLRHVAEVCGETVYLTIRSGLDSICVDRKNGSYPLKVLSIEVGARRPLGVGVGGLVLLAYLPESEAAAITRSNEPRIARHGLSAAKLGDRLRTVRAKGYAYAETGVVRGTKALSVPVFDPAGKPIAAISVAALAERLPMSRVAGLAMLMAEQAGQISRRLAALARPRK